MADSVQIELLKKLLRDEVASFSRQDDGSWRKSISDTISEIREQLIIEIATR